MSVKNMVSPLESSITLLSLFYNFTVFYALYCKICMYKFSAVAGRVVFRHNPLFLPI